MVLIQNGHRRNMFTPSTNTRHHLAPPQVFNFPPYHYQQSYASTGTNLNHATTSMADSLVGSDLQSMNWHSTTGTMYSSCARGYDDWSPQPSNTPPNSSSISPLHGPPHAHVTTNQPSSTLYNYGHTGLGHYRLSGNSSPQVLDYQTPTSSSAGSQFLFPDVATLSLNSHHLGPITSQPSPDSGVAHSSDGVPSGSESPGHHHSTATQPQINGIDSPDSPRSGGVRPQQARSPYEWMKKAAYQSTPNPGNYYISN